MKPGADDQPQRSDDRAAASGGPDSAPADNSVLPDSERPDSERLGGELLDSETIQQLYEQHNDELRRFLLGVVRDPQLAADAIQAALVKAIERGHTAREETRKAWLFRVAYNEALLVRRRQAVADRALKEIVHTTPAAIDEPADAAATRKERAAAVRRAIAALPEEQRAIVRLRIHDNLTFAEAAKKLDIPLGTALTRMRTALAKLKTALDDHR